MGPNRKSRPKIGREAVEMMGADGRHRRRHVYAGRTHGRLATRGSPWGRPKAALESLVRHFAVALAKRGITVNSVSPGLTDDSVLNGLPQAVQEASRAW